MPHFTRKQIKKMTSEEYEKMYNETLAKGERIIITDEINHPYFGSSNQDGCDY